MALFTDMMEEASEQSVRIVQLEQRVRELETDLAWSQRENQHLQPKVKRPRGLTEEECWLLKQDWLLG